MDAEFWHWIWDRNLTGFHEGEANAFLVRYLGDLRLPPGSVIFVPLCGKTRDIGWLRAQGHQVVAIELSQIAVDQLFDDLGIAPRVTVTGNLLCYNAPGLRVYVGDFFDLTANLLGPVALTYDRAALFALPPALRQRYAAHIVAITGGAPQLLISLIYDQSQMRGPPYSVNDGEVASLYGATYRLDLLERAQDAAEEGALAFQDVVWLLRPEVKPT